MAIATLGGGLMTIEGVHTAIADKPFSVLQLVPVVGPVSEAVRVVHDAITGAVYAGVRGALALPEWAAHAAAERTDWARGGSWGDLAVAALNGFAGDRLAREGSPLAIRMRVRHAGRTVGIEREILAATFPGATPRIAVFVHGLASNETLWGLHAERHYGNRHVTYGSRLASDFGYTPLYVRYNTGLHISENGRRLARLLARAVAEWPVPVEEVLLVGHSMGGLVVRSATHYGAGLDWLARVRHVFCLGAPHRGAPLEKLANVTGWLLGRFDVTRPVASALNARSFGIKDLRFGSLRDEDWQGLDSDALLADHTSEVPLLAGAAHYYIAATVTRDRRHALGIAVGDLLVREASALGHGRFRHVRFPIDHGKHFGPMHHLELLNHPAVYDQMRRWLQRRSDQTNTGAPPGFAGEVAEV